MEKRQSGTDQEGEWEGLRDTANEEWTDRGKGSTLEEGEGKGGREKKGEWGLRQYL